MSEKDLALDFSAYKNCDVELLKLAEDLRGIGVGETLKVPCVIFCGSQSAGKSSILQAIADIPLPRGDGSCTRCPIETRLRCSDANWSATIKLHIVEDSYSSPITPQDFEYDVIYDKSDLEKCLHMAQKAVLKPSKVISGLLDEMKWDRDDPSESEFVRNYDNESLEFTLNSVIVEVNGASVNLTIVDLPGMIQMTDSGKEHLTEQINNMIQGYMSDEGNIIVVVINCETDVETQSAIQMARKADPGGKRTIGVLTKADRVQENCHAKWIAMLNNMCYQLENGYYLTRTASKVERASICTDQERRRLEKDYFLKEKGWSSVDKQRIGVSNLRGDLSRLLTRSLRCWARSLTTKVAEFRRINYEAIKSLPEKPLDPATQLVISVVEIQTMLLGILEPCGLNPKDFWCNVETDAERLREELVRIAPVFVNDIANRLKKTTVNSYDSHGSRKPQRSAIGLDTQRISLENRKNVFNISDVSSRVKNERGPSLPDDVPSSVAASYLLQSFKEISMIALDFLNRMNKLFQIEFDKVSSSVLKRFPNLHAEFLVVAEKVRMQCFESTKEVMISITESEVSNPLVVFNKEQYNVICKNYRKALDSDDEEETSEVEEKVGPSFLLAARVMAAYETRAIPLVDIFVKLVYNTLFKEMVKLILPESIKSISRANLELMLEECTQNRMLRSKYESESQLLQNADQRLQKFIMGSSDSA